MELKHFSHSHCLAFHQPPQGFQIQCTGCKSPAAGNVYACWQCSYFLHDQCFRAERSFKHPSHPLHPLTLVPSPTYPSGTFFCNSCNLAGDGFSYSCSACEFDIHVHCALTPNPNPNPHVSPSPSPAHPNYNPHQPQYSIYPPIQTGTLPTYPPPQASAMPNNAQNYPPQVPASMPNNTQNYPPQASAMPNNAQNYPPQVLASMPNNTQNYPPQASAMPNNAQNYPPQVPASMPNNVQNYPPQASTMPNNAQNYPSQPTAIPNNTQNYPPQPTSYPPTPSSPYPNTNPAYPPTQHNSTPSYPKPDPPPQNFTPPPNAPTTTPPPQPNPTGPTYSTVVNTTTANPPQQPSVSQPNNTPPAPSKPPSIIRHFSHPHVLKAMEIEQKNAKVCSACECELSGAAYCCTEPHCTFNLHKSCFDSPREVRHKSHLQHPLTLLTAPPYSEGFTCNACLKDGKAFAYTCATCSYDLHIDCIQWPDTVTRPDHKHSLALYYSSPAAEAGQGVTFFCDVCKNPVYEMAWVYYCRECDFGTHLECVASGIKQNFGAGDGGEKTEEELLRELELKFAVLQILAQGRKNSLELI